MEEDESLPTEALDELTWMLLGSMPLELGGDSGPVPFSVFDLCLEDLHSGGHLCPPESRRGLNTLVVQLFRRLALL